MNGKFTVRVGDVLLTYHNSNDIPLEFDNLINFEPDNLNLEKIPENFPAIMEHAAAMNNLLRDLLKRETR